MNKTLRTYQHKIGWEVRTQIADFLKSTALVFEGSHVKKWPDDTIRYKEGWTDKKVAEHMGNCTDATVRGTRIKLFGDLPKEPKLGGAAPGIWARVTDLQKEVEDTKSILDVALTENNELKTLLMNSLRELGKFNLLLVMLHYKQNMDVSHLMMRGLPGIDDKIPPKAKP